MDATRAAVLAGAAFVAAAINSVAGGGSVVSFPAAVAVGLPAIVANATNTVALTPAALASAWAYRRELGAGKHELRLLLAPAALGGALGAMLVLATPDKVFDASVPALLLIATLLLLAQNFRKKPAPAPTDAPEPPRRGAARWRAVALMLLAAIYGGYFGAGMGIMTLALLGMLGGRDMHRMNAVKTVIGVAVNGAAAIGFLIAGSVHPAATGAMCVGGIAGGLAGAVLARRVDQKKVRWAVIAIGFGLTALLAWQRMSR